MKAYIYKVKAYQNPNDFIHNFYKIIDEIYIPSNKICFNSEGFAFPSEEPRSESFKEIDINEKLAKKLLDFSKLRVEIKEIGENIFEKYLTELK